MLNNIYFLFNYFPMVYQIQSIWITFQKNQNKKMKISIHDKIYDSVSISEII